MKVYLISTLYLRLFLTKASRAFIFIKEKNRYFHIKESYKGILDLKL